MKERSAFFPSVPTPEALEDVQALARNISVNGVSQPYSLPEVLNSVAYAAIEYDDDSLKKLLNELDWQQAAPSEYGYSLLWLAIQLNNLVLLEACLKNIPQYINNRLYYPARGKIGGIGPEFITPVQGFLYTFKPRKKFPSQNVAYMSSMQAQGYGENMQERLRMLRLFIKHEADTRYACLNFLSDAKTDLALVNEYASIKALIKLNNYRLNLAQEIHSPCYSLTLFFKNKVSFLKEYGFFTQEKTTKLSVAEKLLNALLNKNQIAFQELELTPQEESAIRDGRLGKIFENLSSILLIRDQKASPTQPSSLLPNLN